MTSSYMTSTTCALWSVHDILHCIFEITRDLKMTMFTNILIAHTWVGGLGNQLHHHQPGRTSTQYPIFFLVLVHLKALHGCSSSTKNHFFSQHGIHFWPSLPDIYLTSHRPIVYLLSSTSSCGNNSLYQGLGGIAGASRIHYRHLGFFF